MRRLLGPALLALLVCVPFVHVGLGGLLPGGVSTPGSLQLLALCLVFAGVALSYDLLFGYTGLLSFGHALYFALGVYLADIALTKWHWQLWEALLVVAAIAVALPAVLGSVSLRVGGIAFAMVTLAFAQAGAILVQKNPWNLTGGEEGLGLDVSHVPGFFVGVLNTKYLYWLALGYAVVVFAIVQWAVHSSPGRIWQAIRENELRVEVLGLRPWTHKLLAFVLASFVAAAGGVVYLLLIGGASTEVTTPNFTLSLLLMVVLGGAGTRYGALLGGAVYTYLDVRLPVWSDSHAVRSLPGVLRTPLSEPLFVLGTIFVLLVLFLPGGLAGLSRHGRRRGLALLERSVRGRTTSNAEAPV